MRFYDTAFLNVTKPITTPKEFSRLLADVPLLRTDKNACKPGPVILTGHIDAITWRIDKIKNAGFDPVAIYPTGDLPDNQKELSIPIIKQISPEYESLPLLFCGKFNKAMFGRGIPESLLSIYHDPYKNRTSPDSNLEQHFEELCLLFDMLHDVHSKNTLLSVVKARMLGVDGYFRPAPYREYCHPLAKAEKGDNVIDAGAFTGDTAALFSKFVGKSGRVLSFEPSMRIFPELCGKCLSLPNVIPIYGATWDSDCVLMFDLDKGDGSGDVGNTGNSATVGYTIDSIAEKFRIPIHLIKLDVEGAEKESLIGARNVILRDHPKLHISVYHKQNDLWELPLLILSMRSDYELYLGHHNYYATETDLYAIPKKRKNIFRLFKS